nr:hypothetical protein GCM10020092_026750 [Actinoplanes digitatis]
MAASRALCRAELLCLLGVLCGVAAQQPQGVLAAAVADPVHDGLRATADLAQHLEPGGIAGLELDLLRLCRQRWRDTHGCSIGARRAR